MLYKIGTKKELVMLGKRIPEYVSEKLLNYVNILDDAYGENRDYSKYGGYIIMVENGNDILKAKSIIDYENHIFEWIDRIGDNYLAVMFLLNDDFAIVLCMPIAITPNIILQKTKGEIYNENN